jgi:2-polyprenyl-3-methyl-5-hydroxy-6-metoxy-1,4-benzoquinol methylase
MSQSSRHWEMKTERYLELRWTPDRVARFWDWQSQYPETYFTYQFGAEIARSLRRYLHGRRRVLDYGCGAGYLLPHLCRYAQEAYGADLSPESVARTNEKLAGTPAFAGAIPIADLRQKAVSFDAILAVEVIEHLYDEDLAVMLADVRTMLAPSGIAIFTTPNDEDREKNMVMCPATGELFHRWQHVRSWDAASLRSRLQEAGFAIVDISETNLAASRSLLPIPLLKRAVKRLLLGNPGKPHLVCVATARSDGAG